MITLLFAAAGAIFGSQYNVLNALQLPRVPVKEGDLVTARAIALVVVLVATLIASVVGALAERRYHTKVDRVGYAV